MHKWKPCVLFDSIKALKEKKDVYHWSYGTLKSTANIFFERQKLKFERLYSTVYRKSGKSIDLKEYLHFGMLYVD